MLLNSELVALNHSYDAAMNWKEFIVDRYIAERRSLDMLPGGFKGLRYLHQLGHLSKTVNALLEEREHAMLEYAKQHSRAGVPNRGKLDFGAKGVGGNRTFFPSATRVLVHLGILGRRKLAAGQKTDGPRSANALFHAVSRH